METVEIENEKEELKMSSAEVDGGESGAGEDWNVDECRGDHESDEHWELRRQFMITNKGRFPKLRIVCLSQVFANMEFLGCKYPVQTMELVSELSAGIIEEYRKNQQGRLQRTFVKASDAAERKTKGTKRPQNFNPNRPTAYENKHFKSDSGIGSWNTLSPHSSHFSQVPSSTENKKTEVYEDIINQNDDVRGLVLVKQLYVENEGPLQVLHRSCGMCHKSITYQYNVSMEGDTFCTLKIGKSDIAVAKGSSKAVARMAACERAWNELKKVCFTIEVKAMVVSTTEVSKTDVQEVGKDKNALKEDNVGNKLLKLMGWSGGGLGKDQQGIEIPVSTPDVVERGRLGIGLTSKTTELASTVKTFLENQKMQCAQFDLQFSSEFNQDERKIIHQIASQLGLKSKSHGKADNRYLVISRKIQMTDLVREILETGETAKYRIIEPDLLKNRTANSILPPEASS